MSQLPSTSAAIEPLLLFITAATLFTYPLAVSASRAGAYRAPSWVGGALDRTESRDNRSGRFCLSSYTT